MCGILGVVDNNKPINEKSLMSRCDRLSHRGPDGAGLWIGPNRRVGMAHRRLKVLDLSQAAKQPMVSKDGRYVLLLNGEIYNYRELRTELQKLGVQFESSGDSEVLLAAYQAWGEACLERLNGMFAFVVYDVGLGGQSPSLFLARDRVGKKPLYYRSEPMRFQFASELKAIEATEGINLEALNFYLALGYVPGALCLAQGVHKLPPGHAARLDLGTMRLTTWRYWRLPAYNPEPADISELVDRTESLLMSSVDLRMRSDVPFGVLLSGGLDSNLITAAASAQTSVPVKTFTYSVPGSEYDESSFALRVAKYFGTEHHVLEAARPALDIVHEMEGLIDEPIADSSILPYYSLSNLTRKHVTVALGGDGGDEIFGGYESYPHALRDARWLSWLPANAVSAAANMAARLPAGVRGRNRILSLVHGPMQQMIWGTPYFDVALRRRILSGGCSDVLGSRMDAPEQWLLSLFRQGSDPIDRMTRTHFNSVLTDGFLAKVDRASMAHGLEIRSPFLDYRLVEFAFSKVPSDMKVARGLTRRIERLLADRLLPADLRMNRKQGFSIPLDDWLRKDGCSMARELMRLLPAPIDKSGAEALIAGQMRGRANGARLFSLMMLGLASRNNGW